MGNQTNPTQKTVLAPCMGVGKIVANVTRRAAYLIHEQNPEGVELLSLPALLAGDAHERELLQNNPSIIIDGCALRCTAHIFRQFGVEPASKIEVNQIMKEKKVGPGRTRKELEAAGKKLSDFTAERVMQALEDEGLSAEFIAPDDLSLPPPDASCGCPHRLAYSDVQSAEQANASDAENKSAAEIGNKESGEPSEDRSTQGHEVKSVTILPCQGIKRSGGRVTQRAAYHVVEDRYLGRSQVLCISALAAGVEEDVVMLEKYPTVAVNGCNKRCASIAAEYHGIPAVAHVELPEADPEFNCEEFVYEADLTEREAAEALKLADAISVKVDALMGKRIEWQESKIDLHGLVHEPGKINALTGFADGGKGYLVKLAKAQIAKTEPHAAAAKSIPVEKQNAPQGCPEDYPGYQRVVSSLFKPKGGA